MINLLLQAGAKKEAEDIVSWLGQWNYVCWLHTNYLWWYVAFSMCIPNAINTWFVNQSFIPLTWYLHLILTTRSFFVFLMLASDLRQCVRILRLLLLLFAITVRRNGFELGEAKWPRGSDGPLAIIAIVWRSSWLGRSYVAFEGPSM
jgi:hypothetical protein